MPILILWTKALRCKGLYIKRAIFFPLIVDSEYILIASFLPLFMAEFLFSLCFTGRGKGAFVDKLITLIGACE